MNTDIPKAQDGEQALPFSDNAISSAITKLMEHPELISMVASALGNNGDKSDTEQQSIPTEPISEDTQEVSSEKNEDTPVSSSTPLSGDAVATLMPMLSKLSSFSGNGKSGRSAFRHEQLLCALKPYVSPGRCQAIDYILRISQISGLIGKLR